MSGLRDETNCAISTRTTAVNRCSKNKERLYLHRGLPDLGSGYIAGAAAGVEFCVSRN
jgi:hypothetical protein